MVPITSFQKCLLIAYKFHILGQQSQNLLDELDVIIKTLSSSQRVLVKDFVFNLNIVREKLNEPTTSSSSSPDDPDSNKSDGLPAEEAESVP